MLPWIFKTSILTILFLHNHVITAINLHLSHDSSGQTAIENETNIDATCKCKNGDVGLEYICESFTPDIEGCALYVVNSLRKMYRSDTKGTFKRTRKQLSINGAMSSIVSMLEGERLKNKEANMRARIQAMG